ncbi:hypothetical protein [Janthinobacterium sp. ROICE36]|nr:hypothetical protein [Janthinobacterium sp. ROICE36]
MPPRLRFAVLSLTSIAFTQAVQADQLAAIKAKGAPDCRTPDMDEPNSFI